jgi:uncharacterized membrane protein
MLTSLRKMRSYFLRTETDRLLSYSMLFSAGMVLAGMLYTGRFIFIYLVWNLFLAYIPYAISNAIQYKPQWIENRWKLAVLVAAWLLFIPNSFYILTDIFHLGEMKDVPLWYHLILLVSFAWNGMLLGIVSLRQMERLATLFIGRQLGLLLIYPTMWVIALGIYIGRYMRYNSWDIVVNPIDLSRDIARMVIHPIQNLYAWGMVFCFSIFMTIVYHSWQKIGRG